MKPCGTPQIIHRLELSLCFSDSFHSEEKYVTVQSYSSQGKDEVSFDRGVTVEVIQKNLEGWWYVR